MNQKDGGDSAQTARLRVPEVGSLQQITDALVTLFLEDEGQSFPRDKMGATELFNLFTAYIEREQYKVKPALLNFGRAMSAKVPVSRLSNGVVYHLLK